MHLQISAMDLKIMVSGIDVLCRSTTTCTIDLSEWQKRQNRPSIHKFNSLLQRRLYALLLRIRFKETLKNTPMASYRIMHPSYCIHLRLLSSLEGTANIAENKITFYKPYENPHCFFNKASPNASPSWLWQLLNPDFRSLGHVFLHEQF